MSRHWVYFPPTLKRKKGTIDKESYWVLSKRIHCSVAPGGGSETVVDTVTKLLSGTVHIVPTLTTMVLCPLSVEKSPTERKEM